MTRNAFVFRAARASRSAASFGPDMPWLSGVAVRQANASVTVSCACTGPAQSAPATTTHMRRSDFPGDITVLILSRREPLPYQLPNPCATEVGRAGGVETEPAPSRIARTDGITLWLEPHDADRLAHRRPGSAVDDRAFPDFRVPAMADVDAAEFRIEDLAAQDQDLARVHDFDGAPLVGSSRAAAFQDEVLEIDPGRIADADPIEAFARVIRIVVAGVRADDDVPAVLHDDRPLVGGRERVARDDHAPAVPEPEVDLLVLEDVARDCPEPRAGGIVARRAFDPHV